MNTCQLVLLCGFRATGKSTIGPLLARKLQWQYVEMDTHIQTQTGKSIPELTQNGTEWIQFRRHETEVLQELLSKNKLVISCGGGVGVNNVNDNRSGKTFGELQKNLIQSISRALVVTLFSNPSVLVERLRTDEMKKNTLHRPLLKPEKAKILEKKVSHIADDSKKRDIYIEEVVADSLAMYHERLSLYKTLSAVQIDTSIKTPEVLAEEIITTMTT